MYFSVPENTRNTIFYCHWLKEKFLLMVKFCKSHTRNQFINKKDAIKILLVITLLQYVKVLWVSNLGEMGKIMKAYRGFSVAAKLWWFHNCVCLLYLSLNFINSFFFEAQVNLPLFTFLSTHLHLIAQEFFSNTKSWLRYYETTMLMFKWTAWKLEV